MTVLQPQHGDKDDHGGRQLVLSRLCSSQNQGENQGFPRSWDSGRSRRFYIRPMEALHASVLGK